MNTKRLVTVAVLIALYTVLSLFSANLGLIKLTFESFPVLVASLMFGWVDGLLVGAAGGLLNQMLTYGFTVTTLMWILPNAMRGLPTKKGLAECLTGLRARSLRLALATSTDRTIVERYVQATPAMQNAFDVMICGPEGGRSKPAPDIYLEAARRLGLEPGECLGVEDSRNGLRSLTAAGCVSVMIPDLLPYDDSLAPYVKHRLSDLGQLCTLADRLNLEARARS